MMCRRKRKRDFSSYKWHYDAINNADILTVVYENDVFVFQIKLIGNSLSILKQWIDFIFDYWKKKRKHKTKRNKERKSMFCTISIELRREEKRKKKSLYD
jgi:hypothetical protein